MLHLACLYANNTAVKKILRKNPTLTEFIEPSGNTTTLYQLSQSNEELITDLMDLTSEEYQEKKQKIKEMLLSNITSESFLYSQNALGETPLHEAVKLNKVDILNKLLCLIKKENRNNLLLIKNKNGYRAFDYAFESNNEVMAEILWTEEDPDSFCNKNIIFKLLKNEISNFEDQRLNSLLSNILHDGDIFYLSVIKRAVCLGANVNYINSYGDTVLHEYISKTKWSFNCCDFEIIKFLIEAGADITIRNNTGKLAFDDILDWCLAYEKTTIEQLEYLMQKGVHIYSLCQKFHKNMLYAAIDSSNPSKVTWALEHGTDINAEGGKPLYHALKAYYPFFNFEIIKMLIDAGATINSQELLDERPFDYALNTACGKKEIGTEVLEYLVNLGANVNSYRHKFGDQRPIISAIKSGDKNKVRWLINHGAEVNIQDNNGDSLLHIAATKDNFNIEIIKTLIDAGAKTNVKSKNRGYLPLDIALYTACSKKEIGIEALEYLVNQGANIDAMIIEDVTYNTNLYDPKICYRILLRTIQLKDVEKVKWLLNQGANTNALFIGSLSALGAANQIKNDAPEKKEIISAIKQANNKCCCVVQ